MAYQALYRKYRPLTFSDVCGQDHIIRALTGQLKSGSTGHAYLFCGTRGTGKTTVAKILSRALNCEHPEGADPCNSCPACESILKDSSLSVFEVDGASNTGIDNVRQIIEAVQYPPQSGKKKVFIIDEVHMLSAQAFNALLKTLEEPPEYAVFILCTTDPGKVLQTIVSRCQRYDFRHIPLAVIADRLSEICRLEGIDADENAIRYIASAGDGSLRDALSLLDECRAYGGGSKITYEEALNALGAVDTTVFGELLGAMKNSDIPGALDIIARITSEGREIGKFVNDYTWYLRNVMLVSVSGGDVSGLDEVLGISPENLGKMQEDAEDTELSQLIGYIRAFAALSGRIRYEAQKRILVECEMISLMTGSGAEAPVKTAAPAGRIPSATRKSAATASRRSGAEGVDPARIEAKPAEPAPGKAAAPGSEPAEPVPEKAASPASEPAGLSAPEKTTEPAPEPAEQPVAEKPAEPAPETPEPAGSGQAGTPAPDIANGAAAVLIDDWEAVVRSDDDPLERMCLSTADIRVNGDRVTIIQQNALYTERLRRDVEHVRSVLEKYAGCPLRVTVTGDAEEAAPEEKPQADDVVSELADVLGVPVEEED